MPAVRVTRTVIVINVVIFQLAWITCIEAAAHHVAWLGVIAIVIAIGVHIFLSEHKTNAAVLATLSMVAGIAVETLLVAINATQFNDQTMLIMWVPLWMVALWGLLSTTLNVSLRWLRGRYVLAAAFGAIGGPLSYFSGNRIGALDLPLSYSLVAISVCWALSMPMLLLVAKRWDALV